MRILITGASGFIGRSYVQALSDRGHEVVAVSRSACRAARPTSVHVIEADPTVAGPWQEAAMSCDAAITLAGEHVAGRRWSDQQKEVIRSSRILSTRRLLEAWSRQPRPRVLLGCSATHYYGPRDPGDVLDESAPAGETFMARAMRDWEAEANRAAQDGARVVNMRISVVLGEGGAVGICRPLAKAFLGHMAGAADAKVSWIHHEDNVGLMLHALERDDLHGPFNMTVPTPVTWSRFMRTLAQQLGRPFTVPIPRWAARVYQGEAAELWFSGQHVHPAKALETGYVFKYLDIDAALKDVLRRP